MNTPAHLLIGAAAFGRNGGRGVLPAAIVGALLPDVSLYLMAGAALFVFNIPPQVVFDDLYFSEAWQTVFAIDNSFVIWGMLFAIAFLKGLPWTIALTGAALLHLCLDFPLHHDDGRPHFWPVSAWVFESPLLPLWQRFCYGVKSWVLRTSCSLAACWRLSSGLCANGYSISSTHKKRAPVGAR